MHNQLVAETTLKGLRPLGIGGQQILDSWGKIDAYLRTSLGDAHADLFAEPQPTGAGLTWFSGPEGDVIPYGALDDDAQCALAAELETRIAAIRGKIEELRSSKLDSDQTLAETLDRALVLPQQRDDREFLYSVGGEPVLVNWGTRDEAAQPTEAVLQEFLHEAQERPRSFSTLQAAEASEPTGPDQTRPAAAGTAAAAVQSFWTWPLWLLFALLVATIMYVLLAGCGMGLPQALRPAWLDYCPGALANAAEPDRPVPEQERAEALSLELRELERRIAQIPRCPRPAPPIVEADHASEEASPTEDVQPADDESERRVQEAGGDPSDYQITLWWDGDADLDLHLECPNGSRVAWDNMASAACGAELNIDANRDAGRIMRDPVEHIIWPRSVPPNGHYRILVDNYAGRSTGRTQPVPYQVHIKLGGVEERLSGGISESQNPIVLYEFDIP